MEQGAMVSRETADLQQRVTALETAAFYSAKDLDKTLGDYWLRLHHLEQRKIPPPVLFLPEHLASLKLGVAVLLLIGVFLLTGSPEHAIQAAKAVR